MAKQGMYADYSIPTAWWPTLEDLRPVRYRWGGRKLSSLGALVDACLDLLPAERRLMIWERLGPEKTLQEVGDAHGVTRERVRQVVGKVTRTFLQHPHLRLVLDGVFSGLSSSGPLVVNVREARSVRIPGATPAELWTFIMNVWCEVQKRPAQSRPLDSDIFLFAPDGLPSAKTVREVMMARASFLSPGQLASALGIHPTEVEVVACAFPQLVRTNRGLYGYLSWTQPQLMKAVAEQLARAEFDDWHFSEIGKAMSVFDRSLEGQSSRNFAAVLARKDVVPTLFEQAGRNGYWRLASLGDGHSDNYAAIHAILEASETPLHWTDIQAQLRRTVNDGTVIALLVREGAFKSLGKGVFGLDKRDYPTTQPEDQFMIDTFRRLQTEALEATMVFKLAEAQDLEPQRLLTVGRFSSVFRYWKWGKNEALFLTPEEANRRFFQRWLLHRNDRKVPSEDVLLDGLEAAFQRGDLDTLRISYEWLQQKGHPIPPLMHYWIHRASEAPT